MVNIQSEPNTDAWRILLFGQCGDALLVLRSALGFRLPELRIPCGQRVAPNLNTQAKRQWNLDTVCLMPLDLSGSDLRADGSRYHVMEVCQPEALSRVAPQFMQMSELKENSFADPRDHEAVREAIRLETAGMTEDGGPFSGFGAFKRIAAWVEEQLQPLGLRLDREFHQLQATASFALIRFATSRGAAWFKAVGDPNLREFPITRLLAARIPQYVPKLLAVKTDWNAWLAAEAPGQGLFESSDPAIWCRAAESLAELQIVSLPHIPDLLAVGSHDVRSQKLLNAAGAFFSVMEETMQAQTKTTVSKLTPREIAAVHVQVNEALHEMEEARIPNALNHLDLNSSNVVVSTSGCTFLDWAQGAVGNPLFSLEYLRQQFLQIFPGQTESEREFSRSYLERWKSIFADKTAELLSQLVPLTATFAFAASALPWDDPNLRRRPKLAGILRSLVRRMHRESEQLKMRRAA